MENKSYRVFYELRLNDGSLYSSNSVVSASNENEARQTILNKYQLKGSNLNIQAVFECI